MTPSTVLSDYAKANMPELAAAASQGLITTRISGSAYGRVWRATSKGIRSLE